MQHWPDSLYQPHTLHPEHCEPGLLPWRLTHASTDPYTCKSHTKNFCFLIHAKRNRIDVNQKLHGMTYQEFYMIVSLQCMIWGVKTGVKKERNWELFLKLCAQITELRPLKSTECFTLIPGSQPVLCAISYIRKHWLERFHPQERTHAERLWAGSHSSVVRALAVQVMGPGFNSQQLRVFIQCGFVSNWAKLI